MVTIKKSVVKIALELVQEDTRAYHCFSICREAVMQKKPIVDISNKGMDREKTPKINSSIFLKACMPP
jgi:hypothetical protein